MDATPELSAERLNELFRARVAVSLAFFLLGAAYGVWAVHIPVVTERLAIDSAVLGAALFTMAVGAVLGMPVTGGIIARIGSRFPTAVLTFAFVLLFPLPIIAGNVPFLFVSAFFFGVAMGGLDVAVNTQAADIEKLRRRPTMSSFHGFFSVGGLVGALLGAAIIAAGWGNGEGAVTVAVAALGLAAMSAANLWTDEPHAASGPHFVLPSWAVIGVGMLCFLCFALEGAIADWSALYLTTDKGASPAMAATGFALYSLAMSVCRLTGDAVVVRLGPKPTLIVGGLLCAMGTAIAILMPLPLLSATGFLLVGIGAANVVPVLFSTAARTPGVPASIAVAAITTLGYSGFLIAPPVLGVVADNFGLSVSLWLVALMGLAIALGAIAMHRR